MFGPTSPAWWLILEVIAVLALAGWIGVLLLLRAKQHSELLMQHYRADAARLQLRVQTLERGSGNTVTVVSAQHDYLNDAIDFCEQRLNEITKHDPHYAPLQWRFRALKSEALARETGANGEAALPLVIPAYTAPSGRRAVVAGKDAGLLRQRLNDAEIEIARLKTSETLYHDLRAAVNGHAARGLQITQQLQQDLHGADAGALSLLDVLHSSYAEMLKLMQKADGHTPLNLSPDLRLALEQGAQLQAALLHDQQTIAQLRDHVDTRDLTDVDHDELQKLRAQVKSQHSQVCEAMMCIDTLEHNLSEAQILLKKLVERARRYQDQDSRIAILEARCKQGDKDLRMVAQVNAQMDTRCQQLNQQLADLHQGGDPALQMAQRRVTDKQQEMERLHAEKTMLEDQVVDLDQWRDRAEQAEAQLKRALVEKQMFEDELDALMQDEDEPTSADPNSPT